MAIVIEEERIKVNPLTLAGWGVILLVVALTIYYIFFKKPEIADLTVPPHFANTERVSQINLDPDAIIGSTGFRNRQQYVNQPLPENLGRRNPFIPL